MSNKITRSKELTKLANVAGGAGGYTPYSTGREDPVCGFTYDGYNFAGGPYYDCRDACANYPADGLPSWECDAEAEPCDYFIFISDEFITFN